MSYYKINLSKTQESKEWSVKHVFVQFQNIFQQKDKKKSNILF